MKRIFGFAAAAVLMTLTACGSNSANHGGSTVARPPGANGTAYTASSGYGVVTGQGLQANIASMYGTNASEIGDIASPPDGNTGVFFLGAVQTSSSILSGGNVQASGGTLNFEVWDSFVGQIDSTGKQIPPITIGMTLVNATINPQNTSLVFQNQGQTAQFTFTGTYSQSTFQGQLTYANNQGSITVGNFSVATCAFFRCQ
jgi:hypothetical protein